MILGGVGILKLYDIIKKYPVIDIVGSTDIDVYGIEHDSRKVKDRYLFVAQRGFTNDGHEFINEAINNGAIAILSEKDVDLNQNMTIIKVRDSLDALGYVSSNFYGSAWDQMTMIGITGTNGKTSTTYYLKNILDYNDSKVGVLGTIGAIMEDSSIDLLNTTPDSLEIQKILGAMLNKDIEYVIMEVSSHALDLKRVKYMDYDIGIFMNLSEEHLDYHKTMEKYLQAKLKLFLKTKKYNIINIDDFYGKIIKQSIKDKIPCISYGLNSSANIYASNIEYNLRGVGFTLNTPKGIRDIRLNIPGKFSVYNALAAAACSYALDIDLDIIKKGLENLRGVKGRFELVPNPKDLNIIIDFAHTPEGLEQVLSAIKNFATGKIFVVFGAGGNRDKSKRPLMGKVVASYADLAIVTTDNPRFEDPEKIIEDIIIGIKEVNGRYIKCIDRKKAIEYAILEAGPEDIILLAGKGHETNMIIDGKLVPFDERMIVLNITNKI